MHSWRLPTEMKNMKNEKYEIADPVLTMNSFYD